MGDPRGPGGAVTWRLDERFAVRGGVHVPSSRQTRTGRACAGLVEPGTCPEEELSNRTSVTGALVGLVATVLRRDAMALALVPTAAIDLARLELGVSVWKPRSTSAIRESR